MYLSRNQAGRSQPITGSWFNMGRGKKSCSSLIQLNHTGIFRGKPAFDVDILLQTLLKAQVVSLTDRVKEFRTGDDSNDSMLRGRDGMGGVKERVQW